MGVCEEYDAFDGVSTIIKLEMSMFYAHHMVEYLVFCLEHNVFLLLKKRTYPRILHGHYERIHASPCVLNAIGAFSSPQAENFDICIPLNHIFTYGNSSNDSKIPKIFAPAARSP